MKMRPCAVSGMFYPSDPDHLEQLLAKFFSDAGSSRNSKGVVAPHAGYIYSGRVAALSYASINPGFSGTFILVGPSHRGFETCISMVPWETPLGIVDNDNELGEALNIDPDEISHQDEHSLEVQVPFIKYRFPRARITPIMMGRQDLQECTGVVGADYQCNQAYGAGCQDYRIIRFLSLRAFGCCKEQ